MHVIVWGINYAPEVTGIAPYNVLLCEYLRGRGHQVEMVTSFAYYPLWRKRPDDAGCFFRTDLINNVPVHRCWHYVPAKVTAVKRMLHEASFIATSLVRLVCLPSPDLLVVISPPLLLGWAAALMSQLRGVPYVFHVQDLQPDAALGLGMLKPGWLAKILYWLESYAYTHAARVSGITRGMLRAFSRKSVPAEKQLYFPNSVAACPGARLSVRGSFRQRLGVEAGRLLAVYSGNLGVKQGLAILLEAAVGCPNVQIVICGDGAEREALARRAAEQQVKNVLFLPLQAQADYTALLEDADLCLITQQAGSGQWFFPSKLLTTLAYGKPVLAVADEDSELAEAVRAGGFGDCVSPKDAGRLAERLNFAAGNRAMLSEMGARGRAYVAQFAADKVLPEFERALEEVVRSKQAPLSSKIPKEKS